MANEDKSARYHRLRRRTALLDTIVQALFLILLVLSGASIAIRANVEVAVGTSFIPVVITYVLVLAGLSELLHLPFAFYQGVVLERRYGLSRETAGRWLADHIKAAALVLAYLALAGIVVAALIRLSPDRWWLFAAICFAVVLIGVGAVRAGAPAPPVLRRAAARSRRPARAPDGARREGRDTCARRVRVAPRRSHEQSQCGTRWHWQDASHPGVRHLARGALRSGDRDRLRPRARASCLRRHLVGAGARGRARDR